MLRSNRYIEAWPCFACFLDPKIFFQLAPQIVCVANLLAPQIVCVANLLAPQIVCVANLLAPQIVCYANQKKLPLRAIFAGARHVTFSCACKSKICMRRKNRSFRYGPKAFCKKAASKGNKPLRGSFFTKSLGDEKSYPYGPYGAWQGTTHSFFEASKKLCHTFTLVVLRRQLLRISSCHSLVEAKFVPYMREFVNTITVNFCRAVPQIAFPKKESKRSFASTKKVTFGSESGARSYTQPIWGTASACVQNLSSETSAPTYPSLPLQGTARHGIEKTIPNSRTIVVTSGKGGVGKTTTTANLGMSIARLGYRVALIDADIGLRNLDLLLGLENRVLYTAMDIFEGECRLDQALIRDKRLKNLSLLAISKNRQRYNVTRQKMESLVSSIAALGYSFVLIDCPAGIDVGFINAISPAQEALIVTTPEITAMRDADRVAGLLEANGIYNAKLLINRVRPDMIQRHDMMSVQDVQDVLGIPLLGAIPEDLDVIVSTNRGEPLVLRKKLTLSGIAFENAARRLIGKQDYVIDLKTPYKSFFQKMKSIFTE